MRATVSTLLSVTLFSTLLSLSSLGCSGDEADDDAATGGTGVGAGLPSASSGDEAGSGGTSGPGAGAGGGGEGGSVPAGQDYPMPAGVGTGPAVYASPDGNDANDGLSLATPVRTLEVAVEIAEPGSIIYLRAGLYDGLMISDGAFGTADQWILMRPYESESVTIRGSGSGPTIYFYADSCDEENGLVSGDCARAYFRLEGLSIQGSPQGGGDGNVIKIDTPQVQIIKNKLCCSVADVIKNVRTADDTKIVGNEIWQDAAITTPSSNAQGIDITGADRLLVAGNYLHDLTDVAMYAKGNARSTVFESNRVHHTGLSGDGNAIMCGQSTDAERLVDGTYESYDCVVRNNIVSDVAGACVAVGSSQAARVYNNTCIDTAKSIHAALFLTNESEVGQASTDVEMRGNLVVQSPGRRGFTDTDDECMTDWSTLRIEENLFHSSSGSPSFSLKNAGLEQGSLGEWASAYASKTGQTDSSVTGDPELDASQLYMPTSTSPAVDAMNCVVTGDYDGTARPQGARCDIGAHEFEL